MGHLFNPVIRSDDANRRRSFSRWAVGEKDSDARQIIGVLEVHGFGAVVMRATSGYEDGRLVFEGISIFTEEQIRRGNL